MVIHANVGNSADFVGTVLQRRTFIGTPLFDLAYVTAFGGVHVKALRVCFASESLQSSVILSAWEDIVVEAS